MPVTWTGTDHTHRLAQLVMPVTWTGTDHTHRLAQLVTPQSPGLAQITLTDLHNWLRHSPLDWHRSHSQTCTTGYATVPWTGTDHTHRLAQLVTPQSPGLAQITLTDLHNWLRHSPLDWHRSHSQTCTTGYATVPWTGTDHTHRLAQLVTPQSPGLAQITLTDLHNWLRHSPLDWHRSHSQTCTTGYTTVPWTGTGLIIAQTCRQGTHLILSDMHAG